MLDADNKKIVLNVESVSASKVAAIVIKQNCMPLKQKVTNIK